MKSFLSAADIEAVAARGQKELMLDGDTVLTDLARRTADSLGVVLMTPASGSPGFSAGPADRANTRPTAQPSSQPSAFMGRPKGCQAKPGSAVRPAAANGSPSQVVDQLVNAIKSQGGQNIPGRN